MATITGTASEKVWSIQRWLGLNENPDGDTKLKMGESAAVRNFRVTRDGNLQKRPGTREVLTIAQGKPVLAVWSGRVQGQQMVAAVCDGKLWSLWGLGHWEAAELGSLGNIDRPHLFGFGDKLWILTGYDYYCWDGTALARVTGYIPLVAVAIPPMVNGNPSGGELLEQVNKLNAKRRAWLSPDGENATFQLPETGILSVDYVRDLLTNEDLPATAWTADLALGQVTMTAVPPKAVSSLEVGWTASRDYRGDVTGMHYSESYNGVTDARIFLYGDGSNTAIYSDLDENGQARADYFPDQNEMRVGVGNTPITGLLRHYSALIAFKEDSTYSVQYGTITLANGSQTAGFYVVPVNRSIGLTAMGQAQLVLNNPVTLYGRDLYEWVSSSGALTQDERQAQRISDRVWATLQGFTDRICYDDNDHQEYYIVSHGQALVWNYAADAWSYYTNFFMEKPFSFEGELYFGSREGRLVHVSQSYAFDQREGELLPIDCYWESGAMSFGADYQRKYSAMLWLGIKPEAHAAIDVSVMTDKSVSYPTKSVSYSLFDFEHVDFSNWTFETNDKPQMRRLKIKAKKFVFYKLVLKSCTSATSATVTSANFRVRSTGYAK